MAVAMEAFALGAQYLWGLEPCNECIYIRAGILGIGISGILGALTPRIPVIQRGAVGLLAGAVGVSLWRAYVLVDIERQVAAGAVAGCKRFKGFPNWIALDRWVPAMFEPRGKCGEVAGTFLGQSFAVWSLVGLCSLALSFGIGLIWSNLRSSAD